MFSILIGNVVRAEGNPVLTSATMIVSAVANIVLDPILIFGLGPFPAMGIAGAATATVLGRSIGAAIFLTYFISGRTSYHLQPGYFMPRLRILIEIYRVGSASIMRMIAGSLIMGYTNRIAASFGVMPLAVVGIMLRFARFAFMPCVGLGQGMLPLVGYNFGAQLKERVSEVVVKAGSAGFLWGVVCWVAVMLFSVQFMAVFNTEPEFLDAGARALRIFALGLFAVGIQIVVSYFFQGIGKGMSSMVLASSRNILFRLPSLILLPRLFGLNGLWLSFPVSDFLAAALTLIWTAVQFRKLNIPFHPRYIWSQSRLNHDSAKPGSV
jgi:putative MATE family efflux protein